MPNAKRAVFNQAAEVEQDKLKLLIVEDDPGLQSQMRWALADRHDVFVAGERMEALDIVAKELPSVVILDLGLPPRPRWRK
jgi:two-component system NtrC family response regulator